MTVNIIHLRGTSYSEFRMQNILQQAHEQKFTFKIWPGFTDPVTVTAISRSHKQIVRWAKAEGLSEVCIMEDDVEFLSEGAFDFFINKKPPSYDLYLGTVSNIVERSGDQLVDFSGMMLYVVHEKFYDKFLSVPENTHIDRALRNIGSYWLCERVVARERPGYSYNRKRVLDRTGLINQYKKYGEK